MNFNLKHFIVSTVAVIFLSGSIAVANTTQLRGRTLTRTRDLGVDDTNSTEFDDSDVTVTSTFEVVDDIEDCNDSLSSLPRPDCPDKDNTALLTGSCSSYLYPKSPDYLRSCEYGTYKSEYMDYSLNCYCDSQKGTDKDPMWMCIA